MEQTEKEPRGFYVEKGSFFAHAAVTLLVLSIAARLLGTMSLWSDLNQMIIHIFLPVGCSLLFIVFILLLGRVALWSTILPVLGGAAFFILSIFNQGPGWPLFICIALAFLASFIYTATLAGMIRGKWLLILVLLLIFAYQVVFRAIPAFGNAQDPVSFVDGMSLLSSLGMVCSVLCASLSFRRKKSVKAEPELPKIKDPVVIQPERGENAQSAENAAEVSAEIPPLPAEGTAAQAEAITETASGIEEPQAAEDVTPAASDELSEN